MTRILRNRWFAIFAAVAAVGCAGVEDAPTDNAPPRDDIGAQDRVAQEFANVPEYPHIRVCAEAAPGQVACHARVRVSADGKVQPAAAPSGFGPADLQSAYTIDATKGAGATIAIVDAMDNPKAEQDLATYRSTFGLPPCTTANGCFKKVNQDGNASPLPAADKGWAS